MPKPHVVIIGGGFAGLAAARELRNADVRLTLVDRTNHHTFQPLLYQVATAGLAPSDVTVPIRWRLRHQKNTTVLMGEIISIDPGAQTIRFENDEEMAFDYLIVAAGARHGYFGHDDWEKFAPGLKSVDDAREIRQRFLLAFERAERSQSADERRALLTFVIVGAGPTGVELAGSIPGIARKALKGEFRSIDPTKTRVVLIEAGPRVLSTFPEDLSRRAHEDLEDLGVEVRTGSEVTGITDEEVLLGSDRIATRTVFWAAGNVASALGKMVGGETDRAGRVKVAADLSVPAHPRIFVVGDLCIALRKDGSPAPAVAPTANQTGAHAAATILNEIEGKPREPFKYFHKGDLATIGRHKAVAAFGKFHIGGYAAWFLWLTVHLMYLVGFRNRAAVLLQWGFAYLTFQRGVRLIVGGLRQKDVAGTTSSIDVKQVKQPAPDTGRQEHASQPIRKQADESSQEQLPGQTQEQPHPSPEKAR